MALIFNDSLLFGAILLIASLSGLISERAGIVNIAINGMMIVGAFAFKVIGNLVGGPSNQSMIIVAMVGAALVSGLFALLFGFATISLKADHVISGTAFNLLAAGLAVYLVQEIAPGFANNNGTAVFRRIFSNRIIPGTSLQILNLIYIIVAVFIAGLVFVYFRYTKVGMRHRSVGENPNASDSAAINVIKYRWFAVAGSGFLAGIAGSMAMAKFGDFTGNVQGLGFVALAIMILGQWRVWIIALGAVAFALLTSFANFAIIPSIPNDALRIIPFALSLISLAVLSRFESAPRAVGQHFDKSKR